MSERYNTLYSLADNLYDGSFPFVISAGKLLFDTATGKALAQLKIKTLGSKTVSALKIRITSYDVAKREFENETEYTYLDLNAGQNSEFGQKIPVPLISSETRSIDVKFVEAVFADGTVITAPDTALKPVQMPESLAVFGSELAEEYKLIYGNSCKYVPKKQENIWICSCGAILSNEFDSCHACGNKQDELISDADKAVLTKLREERLDIEEEERKAEIYKKACDMASYNRDSALKLFESISDYNDSENKIEELKVKIKEQQAKNKKIAKISAICGIVAVIAVLIITKVIIPNSEYSKAVDLMDNGKYQEAIAVFDALGDYKESPEQIKECNYNLAVELMESGKYGEAITAFDALGGYKDSLSLAQKSREKYKTVAISAGDHHTVWLKTDGTVVAVGDNRYGQCNVDSWTDIVAISAGRYHTVGLKSDGTVVAVGDNEDGQCNVDSWTDIVAVSVGSYHTVGLKADGSVVAVGDNNYGQCDVSDWTDIVAISAGYYHTVGLKADGTVVAVGFNKYGQCDVSDWTDIVAIFAGYYHTVGLKADGTVVAVGDNNYGQCDVDSWTDIVTISAGRNYTVGLKSDGTVVAVGYNNFGQCNVDSWTDIVAVSAGYRHTVGLKSDGTVVAVGDNEDGQCDVDKLT